MSNPFRNLEFYFQTAQNICVRNSLNEVLCFGKNPFQLVKLSVGQAKEIYFVISYLDSSFISIETTK